jgi:hypothetical protein
MKSAPMEWKKDAPKSEEGNLVSVSVPERGTWAIKIRRKSGRWDVVENNGIDLAFAMADFAIRNGPSCIDSI